MVRFCDAAMPADKYLVWSVMPVLQVGGSGPNEMMRMQLKMLSPPPLALVLQNLANIRPETVDRWPLQSLSVEACYQKTYEYLWARWADIGHDDRRTLRHLACVPVNDTLVKPSRIFCRLSGDLSPFMFELPRHLGAHEPLLKALGAREAPSHDDLVTFLHELGAECDGHALNPNELTAVVKVLETLTELRTRSSGLPNLLVPDVGGTLVKAASCFLCGDRALLQRVDRNLLHLAHPSLSSAVCASVGIGQLREALEERLEGDAEPFFCHSDLEGLLTKRLQSPALASAIVSIAQHDSLTAQGVSRDLGGLKVVVARTLRTRLFLRPRGVRVGGGGESVGEEGDMQGLDVSAEDGAEVLYFVDMRKRRILVSDSLPSSIDVYNVLAKAVNQVLQGKLAHELLALSVALRAEPDEVASSLARLGISIERSQYDVALACRGRPGAALLPLDAALVTLQPHRRFQPGDIVAWNDAEQVARYGIVVDAGAGEAEGKGAAGKTGIRRLQIRVSAGEVAPMLSSDIMCFKPTSGGHSDPAGPICGNDCPPLSSLQPSRGAEAFLQHPDEQGGQGGHGGGEGEEGGGGRGGGAVSAQEVAGAVERLLGRLDVPLSLEKKELLQSVLELKERVDSG
jgi:sacsin